MCEERDEETRLCVEEYDRAGGTGETGRESGSKEKTCLFI